MSAKRETRASEASEMRARSAKPEGAKRPCSPAGLAGRFAEQACKLVRSRRGQSRESGYLWLLIWLHSVGTGFDTASGRHKIDTFIVYFSTIINLMIQFVGETRQKYPSPSKFAQYHSTERNSKEQSLLYIT